MKKIAVPSFVAGVVAASVMLAVPVAAMVQTAGSDPNPKAYDGTTPSLTLHPLKFIIGSNIDAAGPPGGSCEDQDPFNYMLPVRMHWSGSDNTSGLVGYDVWERGEGEGQRLSDTQATSYDFLGSNYLSECGGGGYIDTFFVVATDNRGNSATTTDAVGQHVGVWQEDGSTPSSAEGGPLAVAKTGTWTETPCACSNGGATYTSRSPGDSLKYVIQTTAPSQTVGVVMGTDRDRGELFISVDGGPSVKVDTYSATRNDRVIVWQQTLRRPGFHTVRLSNANTPGRSRIDVDSVMLTHSTHLQP